MATLVSSKKSTYGSPYCYYTFTVSETSRTSTKVTLKFTVTAKLANSQSYIGTGCGLQAGVYVGGSWRNWTLKSTSESLEEWSGTAAHSKSASFSISADADLNKFTGVKVRVKRTDSLGTACTLNSTSVDDISVASSAIYTISYSANGGTGAPSSQTKNHGTSITLSSTVPTRASDVMEGTTTNYYFKGWGTSSTDTSVNYSPGGKYTSNSSVKLYAIWSTEVISSYDISYTTISPKDMSVSSITIEKKKGASITIGSNISVPYFFGYSFKEWNTQEDGSGISYPNGSTYSTDSNLSLFAIWTPWTHSVQFNANGGTGEPPSSFTKTAGTSQAISEIEPTRNGYIFSHWNTAADGLGISYYGSELYDNDKDGGTVTLYAIWIEDSIEIYLNNGKCKAMNFIETSELLGFKKGSLVLSEEFIEGEQVSVNPNTMYFTEIIEK